MKPLRSILAAGIALAVFTCMAPALTLPVSEDTSTSNVPALAKYAGRATSLHVSSSRQGLIRFEAGAFADSLTAGGVGKARLVIYLKKVPAAGALTLHRITEDWSEGGASFPAYDASPVATIPQASVVAKQFVIIDVTATVQAWLSEPGKDFGFAIVGSGGAQVLLGAKEGPASGYPAQLQIETSGGEITLADDDADGGHTRASAPAAAGNFPTSAIITNLDIANNSIKGKKLRDGSVLGTKLALATVTNDRLALNSVNSANIVDGTITNADLSAGFTFPAGTIADGSVTSAKLAANLTLLGTTTITTADIGSGTINGNAIIGSATITGGSLFATNANTVFSRSATNKFGQAPGVVFDTGASLAGVLIENGIGSDSGGFFANESTAAIFSPADNGQIVAFYDEDSFQIPPAVLTPASFIADDGSLVIQANTSIYGANATVNGNVGIGTSVPTQRLDVRGEVKLGPTGQFFAASGQENLQIVRGSVNFDGVASGGAGFTVTKNGTGSYSVAFDPPFAGAPVVTVSAVALTDSYANLAFPSVTGFTARTFTSAGAFRDEAFSFIAIGAR